MWRPWRDATRFRNPFRAAKNSHGYECESGEQAKLHMSPQMLRRMRHDHVQEEN
jgi:hypothetical protein